MEVNSVVALNILREFPDHRLNAESKKSVLKVMVMNKNQMWYFLVHF